MPPERHRAVHVLPNGVTGRRTEHRRRRPCVKCVQCYLEARGIATDEATADVARAGAARNDAARDASAHAGASSGARPRDMLAPQPRRPSLGGLWEKRWLAAQRALDDTYGDRFLDDYVCAPGERRRLMPRELRVTIYADPSPIASETLVRLDTVPELGVGGGRMVSRAASLEKDHGEAAVYFLTAHPERTAQLMREWVGIPEVRRPEAVAAAQRRAAAAAAEKQRRAVAATVEKLRRAAAAEERRRAAAEERRRAAAAEERRRAARAAQAAWVDQLLGRPMLRP